MANLERVDHKVVVKDLLLAQFSDSPVIVGIAESWAEAIQQIEDSLLEFTENNGVSNATGSTLDIIGSWMGVERQGRLDESYRTAILGRANSEGMDGTTEKLLSGMRVLTGSNLVSFFEVYPATLYPIIGQGWVNGIVEEIQRIRPAGVETRILLAKDLEYQVYGEVGDESNLLANEDDDTYQVVIDGLEYDLTTSVVSSSTVYGTTTTYAEDGFELSSAEPWADVILQDARVVQGFLVDNEGNQIVDDQGNPLTHIEHII